MRSRRIRMMITVSEEETLFEVERRMECMVYMSMSVESHLLFCSKEVTSHS